MWAPTNDDNGGLEIIEDIDDEAETADLDPDKALRDQLDLDSMDFLDIVMELRKRYQLQIPEEEYPQLATLTSGFSMVAHLIPFSRGGYGKEMLPINTSYPQRYLFFRMILNNCVL